MPRRGAARQLTEGNAHPPHRFTIAHRRPITINSDTLMKKLIALVALLATAAGLTAAADKEQFKKEVAAMEHEFCAMAQEKGILAAFQHYAAPDVSFIDTDPRQWRGPAAVLQRMGADRPGVSLKWSPYHTDVSEDGTMGFNYGPYELRSPGPEGKELVRTGWFLTIWKRQPDGSWRYVMDTGVPDKPAAPATAPAAEKKT
jgi:ketosteroid isomerase-like protein